MNRRDFILKSSIVSLMLSIGLEGCNTFEIEDSLTIKKINEKIDKTQLIFLLRRATLGFSMNELIAFESLTVKEIIEKLLNDNRTNSLPLNFEFTEDRLVAIGETWIHAPYRTDVFYEQYRKKSLRAWLCSTVFENSCSLKNQMLFFWLNFYSISDVIEHKYEYEHVNYLYNTTWGNFKQITKDITLDPGMLRFLSGFENTKENPNENYARELLELFTLGRGKLANEGDYTTFTEKDISAIAKVLSGWTDTGWYTEDANVKIGIKFNEDKHDSSNKALSHRFNNAIIENNGELELHKIIDIIFEKKETAIHFTKKLYNWFCSTEISNETEQNIIIPLSQILIKNNYEVKSVLVELLSSEHFYSLQKNSAQIKNPLQYTFDILNFFPVNIPKPVTENYNFWATIFDDLTKMGMELLKPPSVGGWKAYYQAPGYSKLWINAASLKSKKQLIDKLTLVENTWNILNVNVNYAELIKQMNIKSSNELIEKFNLLFFNGFLSSDIKNNAYEILNKNNNSKNDNNLIDKLLSNDIIAIENLRAMINYIFNLPLLNLH